MPKKIPAAEQFTALGIDPSQYTHSMTLAVSQRWGDLEVSAKVDDLRRRIADVKPEPVPTLAALQKALEDAGEPLAEQAAVKEHARLKRNAAVNAWRTRNQLQAALDARELKFAAMRAKKGHKPAKRSVPLAAAS